MWCCSKPKSRRAPWLAACVALAACGAESERPPIARLDEGPASIVVKNRSQYVLNEVRFHRSESYSGADSILSEQLSIGGEVVVRGTGWWYVTALREKNYGGPLRAYTTESPLGVAEGAGYTLMVYDEQFRLKQEPERRPPEPSDIILP